ncbi:MAG: DUF5335 domain-containing protein [Stellaceae bacterium]
MAVRKLERAGWQAFFDLLSKGLVGKRAEIEIASLALGTQVEAEWLPLLGIVYDPKSDVVEVALDGLDHLIHQPRELYLAVDDDALASLVIVDDDGARQTVRWRDPLMLPKPLVTQTGAAGA